ncbi:MAG: polysaccharide deacetylase family protein [Chloroflexi bacterium]|nr:polysaccharide deacetylase family protein [Chloroflexota bacterium]
MHRLFWRQHPGWIVAAALLLGLGSSAAFGQEAVLRPLVLALATDTPSPTATLTSTVTATWTPTPSPTSTPAPTWTPSPTATPTDPPTSTLTPTATPTRTPRPTRTPTSTPTATPLPTPDGQARVSQVPILMYHYISAAPSGAGAVRRDLSVSPEKFEAQLQYLREAGYRTITFSDLVYHLTLGWPLPDRPVILSFDDGYRDNFDFAYPLLQKYGFGGTFYLVTAPIDQGNPDYLSWGQVVRMHEGGMEFGAHSYTHPDLADKPVEYVVWQVLGSKEAIEVRTGEPVRTFAYPSGSYDQTVIDVLRSAHFWSAVTTQHGREQQTDQLLEIHRIRIRGGHTLSQFIALLEGAP